MPDVGGPTLEALIERVAELEARLEESEDTLEAIRRGEIDALVVSGPAGEHRVYTLDGADRPYRVWIEQMQEGAVALGGDGTLLYCNRRLAAMLGVPQERVSGQKLQRFVLPEETAGLARLLAEAGGAEGRGELTLCTENGRAIPVHLSFSLLDDDGTTLLCGVITDLTEQKLHLRELAEANARLMDEIAERERVEDALRQAQKMEAVGQLTGGLAHDFNNLLTGITGSLELLKTRVAQGRLGEVDKYIVAAQGAAARAASLTHRLLAFSRRQTLAPVPTDPNRLIADMEEMIRRTTGPAILLETELAEGLWPTLCDPNQLESAVLNLSINARDAMPDGGRLTIETCNVRLDEPAARDRDMAPGHYVVVCVSDTGTGMPPDVVARAFDPFFTTKPIGLGTGLGLSMIYGFARQSGGQVRIASQLGRGTTVRLYLPRHAAAESSRTTAETPRPPDRSAASETVLIIDDEPTLRMLVGESLRELGYATLEAEDGPSGLQVVQSGARIDLLITDVGLPGGLNGRQVADGARAHRPSLKVLFITGYADKAAVGSALLSQGMQVMTKPFTLNALATKVRSMLTES
jgi:PAS domain S-box-containing protein